MPNGWRLPKARDSPRWHDDVFAGCQPAHGDHTCGSSNASLCSTDLKLTAATKGLKCGRRPRRPLASITARIWPRKQILEKLVPRIAERFAAKIGAETGGKVGWTFDSARQLGHRRRAELFVCEGLGPRVQRHLRRKHLEAKASAPPPAYAAVEAAFN